MKRNILFLVISAIIIFISCNKDSSHFNNNDNSIVRFTSIIGGELQTKASGNKWDVNDKIGVFMKKADAAFLDENIVNNAKNKQYYTLKGDGSFVGANAQEIISFPKDGSFVDFVAYYPYQSTIQNYTYQVNVSNQNSQADIDLLYSDNATKINNQTIPSLNFKHQLSKLVFNVKKGDGISSLSGLTINIKGMKTKASFSLVNKQLVADNASVSEILVKTSANNDQILGEAIVLPISNVEGCEVVFSLPSFGTFKWTIPSSTSFNSGYKYIYNVTLEKSQDGKTSASFTSTIKDWSTGASEIISIGQDPDDNTGGDGTYNNPYTVDQIKSKNGEIAKWVKGYIVAVVTGTTVNTASFKAPFTVNKNILIAQTPNETDVSKCIPIELVDDSVIQACLNLEDDKNHETLLNKLVKIQGTIKPFLGTTGVIDVTAQEGGLNKSYGWFESPLRRSVKNMQYVLHYLPDKSKVRNYSMLYDRNYKLAYWVAYPLHSSYLGGTKRTNAWQYDKEIEEKFQPRLKKGFKEANTDRGHQLPSADRTYSVKGNETTFYYSNMTAQNSQLNQGIWASLEEKAREWSKQCDTLYVITGAEITTKTDKTINYATDNDGKKVARPKYYYKALVKKIGNDYYTIAYKMDNRKPDVNNFDNYRIKVSDLEAETGYTFFPGLSNSVKGTINIDRWK